MINTSLIIKRISNLERLITDQGVMQKDTLTFKEAVNYLDVSSSTLYKMTSTRRIPHYCPGGKKLYFKRSDLDIWMQKNKKESRQELDNAAKQYLLNCRKK